jgi:hypothetical protein
MTEKKGNQVSPTYRILIRRDQGEAQERMHTTDRATAVRYYRGLRPTAGFACVLTTEDPEVDGGRQMVVETTRFVGDEVVRSPGEAFAGFDWTGTPLSPSMEEATEVRGDPYSLSSDGDEGRKRRRVLLGHPPEIDS